MEAVLRIGIITHQKTQVIVWNIMLACSSFDRDIIIEKKIEYR